MPVGASFGGGKIDPNCRALQTALHAPNRLTYCKLFIQLQDSKKAGITMDDCMGQDPQPPVEAPAPPPAPVQIILPSNTPVAAVAPPEYKTEVTVTPEQLIGVCTFAKAISCKPESGPAIVSVSSVCKQMLDAARKALRDNPNSVLIVRGNRNPSEDELTAKSRATNVKRSLTAAGVPSGRVKVETGTGTARTVELILAPQS
jgi:hypothetical protein